ncbi:GtrA family protein [Methylibium sp.]|uniref:GtrA family protein n=1 Tax=Methylibium sp. TaxID=2067992 RepID=UPI0017CA16BC|nr:GtrA family protein [Methylibium sp.]MBA3591359.1 GtrA family protein [Methylibium sp.]
MSAAPLRSAAVRGQFARYFVAGCAALTVHLAVMSAAIEFVGMRETLASSLGLVVSIGANFLLQRRYTFRSSVPLATGAALFVGFALLTLAINAALFDWLTGRLHYLPAQLLSTAVVFVMNFHLNRRFTFRQSTTSETPGPNP